MSPIYTPGGLQVLQVFTPAGQEVQTIYDPDGIPVFNAATDGAVDCAIAIGQISQTDAPVSQAVVPITLTGHPFPRIHVSMSPETPDMDQWTTANVQQAFDAVNVVNNAKTITARIIHDDGSGFGAFTYTINGANGLTTATANFTLRY